MTALKIQHADPSTASTLYFDRISPTLNDEGKGTVLETLKIDSGHFVILDAGTDLHLRAVSLPDIVERERVAKMHTNIADRVRAEAAAANFKITELGAAYRDRCVQSVQSYRIVCPEIKSCPPRRTLRVDRGGCFPGMSGHENGVLAGA